MTGVRYFGRDGQPVSDDEATRLFGDGDARRVARTKVGDAEVSTVLLVIDHSLGEGPPLIFETMVFGGPHDNWCDRYSTEAQAQAGHDQVVAALREGREP